ncbi:hypothetical protein PSHT_05318 [Puccinia striiformis]|uniref:Uncharacterized protein n=1 Tax=Puccinia striiformis TaxID=27350 RepID=A0A2S4WAT4_9BASI|nr:hypothetical protein PSHT_05318 [Puccinia striiformis]
MVPFLAQNNKEEETKAYQSSPGQRRVSAAQQITNNFMKAIWSLGDSDRFHLTRKITAIMKELHKPEESIFTKHQRLVHKSYEIWRVRFSSMKMEINTIVYICIYLDFYIHDHDH